MNKTGSEILAQTVVFNTLIASHMALAFVVKGKRAFQGSGLLIAGVLFILGMQTVITATPQLREVFHLGF